MAQPQRPITQADYDRVRELHSQGLSRNAIAKQMRRSGRTVSRLAAEQGLTFAAERTREATAVKVATARERRAALALGLLDDAERLRAQLFAACTVYNFGGKDNTFEQALISEPSFRDKRDIMTAVGTAVDKAVRLDEYDADPGIDSAKSMLGALAKGLGAAYDQLNQAEAGAESDGD